MLRIFPPLLFSRVWLKSVANDFKSCEVYVTPSLLNRNLQRTVFGGTLFSAFDPFHAILFWQYFAQRGHRLEAWLKSAEVSYKKPVNSRVRIHFELDDQSLAEAEAALASEGRFQKWMVAQAIDRSGDLCVEARLLVYLRNFKGHSANF
jgi:hypothetical protein